MGTLLASTALASAADGPVKLGVLNDQSGIYADLAGPGSVEAARMAVEDFGGSALGKPVEIVVGDHQNKPDIGSSIARRWYDTENVDVILDVPTSGVALAIQEITRDSKKLALFSGSTSSDLTGKACSPYGAQWTIDTYSVSRSVGGATIKAGGDSWFFLTADFAFGHAMERDTIKVIEDNGGKVVGTLKHPNGTNDFSSYLLQAQGSGAKIIGLANAGGDTINSIKQAREFGITGQQQMAALLLFMSDVHSLGLDAAQGTYLASAFYWDLNDETREWSKRFHERTGRMPTQMQAGVYSSTLHYLKAVEKLGTKDSEKVMAEMKATPINDFMTKDGVLREDGRVIRDIYLFQVKSPSESSGEWDYFKLISTIPGEEAFRPLDQGGCEFVKK
ncbi:MAG: ABC transporter substrate-binding protein [Rhizobiaceae bacterium]|nr:ABC transporter substrate-binding protein [Rhizobiaceae bacterium]